MRGRRFLLVLLVAGCNTILGIGEPTDGFDGGGGGTAGSQGGGSGESGDANGGSAGSRSGATGGSQATGGARQTGGSGGESGGGDGGGGASGTGGTAPVVITTEALTGARLNIDFETRLQASGGNGPPYTWEFGDVALPTTLGVVLESDGTLHGAPTATGPFEFDVIATHGNSSEPKQLTLNVTRSRWLVYESDEEEFGKYFLYAVDVTTESLEKTKIPGEVVPTILPKRARYSFSPDGRHLAYITKVDLYDDFRQIPRLYVVDMTGEIPGDPVRVSGPRSDEGELVEVSWSPDSRGLAFSIWTGTVQPFRIYYAPLSNLTMTREVGEVVGEDTWDSLDWVGPDLLTYSTNRALAFTRPFVNVLGQPFEQLFTGIIRQSWPERETALVRTYAENDCLDGVWNLVDFRDGSEASREFVGGYVLGSPGLEYLAYRDPDTKRYDLFRPWNESSIASFESGSTASLDTRYCSPGGWSHDDRLFVAGGDGDRLVVTTIANDIGTSTELSGDYGAVGEKQPPAFSPNDEWLGFSTQLGAFVARNTQGAIGNVTRVDPGSLPSPRFGESPIRFSPDSRLIAYAEISASGRPSRAFVASLSTGQPAGSALDLGFADGSGVSRFEWSPHSTELALTGQSQGGWATTELYLARSTPGGFVVTKLNAPTSCSDMDQTCEYVKTFAFQP